VALNTGATPVAVDPRLSDDAAKPGALAWRAVIVAQGG
jgi:hypothetical protein